MRKRSMDMHQMKTLLLTLFVLPICLSCNKDELKTKPHLLVGLSLQLKKDSRNGLDGSLDGLNYAVEKGITIFGMSPEWSVLEPSQENYVLQDNLWNPLQLLDPDKNKLKSYILVLKMIDTNRKTVPLDLENIAFDDPQMLSRFSKLLEEIFTSDPSVARISHILIGNEIDGYLSTHSSEVESFKTFYQAAVSRIHQLSPNVKVGTIITFNASKQNPQLYNTINSLGDFVCYTYYPDNPQSSTPWQMRPPSEVKNDIDWMVENADAKPIAFTEIGYTSSSDNGASENLQSAFVSEMFNSIKTHVASHKIEFLYYHGMYDYPVGFCGQYGQQQGVDSTYLCSFMNNLGLHNWETGEPKLAWTTFVQKLSEINK